MANTKPHGTIVSRLGGEEGRRRSVLFASGCVALCLATANVRADFPQIQLQPISTGQLVSPVGLVNAGDGSNRLFAVDQRGKIQVIQNGQVLPTPFLDISADLVPARAGFDERGLLGLAFHPDFGVPGAAGEGKFYVNYSAPHPNAPGTSTAPLNHLSTVAEFRVSPGNPNVADVASRRILMTVDEPQFNHDGGQLQFSRNPAQKNYLYVSLGDGGGSNDNDAGHTGGSSAKPNGVLGNAQDKTNLLGKILRIDVAGNNGPNGQYGIPADNPFVGAGGGVRPEIYAYGLRNTWRFSFDDRPGGTGRLFAADVGQGKYEEINLIVKGGNYGWREREGNQTFDPTVPNDPGEVLIDPINVYSHPAVGDGNSVGLSVTGGYVYRGSEIPELYGKYVYGDWSNAFTAPGNGTLLGLEEVAPGVWQRTVLDVAGGNPIGLFITAFGEDESGEMYVVARSALDTGMDPFTGQPGGVIYKIVPEPSSVLLGLAAFGLVGRRASRVGR